ncbi:MAG: nucleotide exchange factor GrpE [Fimbriimonadaceae bacterium]|nr:MAG: nucleotide exchange factor GrpE [Fimbriimonadaceae bacterium]
MQSGILISIKMHDQVGSEPIEENGAGTAPENAVEELAAENSQLAEESSETEDIVAKLKAEVAALNDALMRTMAESQNIQRRLRNQMEQDRKYANESLMKEMIPVLDNFDRSIAAAQRGASPEAVIDGVVAVDKSLRRALEQFGLTRLEVVGKPFDPAIHEAIVAVETTEITPDTVTDELEAGYILADRVVRPARVRVSKAPEA